MSYMAMKEQLQTPENERRIPVQKPVSETITISVAEYHVLTKAATMLEVIMSDDTYDHTAVVNAVKANIENMRRVSEGGAGQ